MQCSLRQVGSLGQKDQLPGRRTENGSDACIIKPGSGPEQRRPRGDGSVFNRAPIDRTGLTDSQQGYAKSIRYALRALYGFVERYGNKNTVLIVLGDHQPSRVIAQANHEVPITIVAHDPKVIDRLSSWGWTNGMLPSSTAPVWLMSAFRNRFSRSGTCS